RRHTRFSRDWSSDVCSSDLPNFADASGAIARRFIVLTMRHSFLGRENIRLTRELLEELPGILNWALDGLARLEQQGGFTEPASRSEERRVGKGSGYRKVTTY